VCPLQRKERYGEEKHFLPHTVFLRKNVRPAYSLGKINEEFWNCWRKQCGYVWTLEEEQHAMNGLKRNSLTGHIRNYESFSAIPSQRKETQTIKHNVRRCLFNYCFHPVHTILNILGKGNEVKELKTTIKRLHVNCILILPNVYMKNSQVYIIDQCQIQYYDYNITAEYSEIRYQNLLSVFH
jgi:hypothetical protein